MNYDWFDYIDSRNQLFKKIIVQTKKKKSKLSAKTTGTD